MFSCNVLSNIPSNVPSNVPGEQFPLEAHFVHILDDTTVRPTVGLTISLWSYRVAYTLMADMRIAYIAMACVGTVTSVTVQLSVRLICV